MDVIFRDGFWYLKKDDKFYIRRFVSEDHAIVMGEQIDILFTPQDYKENFVVNIDRVL